MSNNSRNNSWDAIWSDFGKGLVGLILIGSAIAFPPLLLVYVPLGIWYAVNKAKQEAALPPSQNPNNTEPYAVQNPDGFYTVFGPDHVVYVQNVHPDQVAGWLNRYGKFNRKRA